MPATIEVTLYTTKISVITCFHCLFSRLGEGRLIRLTVRTEKSESGSCMIKIIKENGEGVKSVVNSGKVLLYGRMI